MLAIGIDVSKSTLSCSKEGQVKEFSNDPKGHLALAAWSGQADVWCMEATGRYHEPLAELGYRLGKRCFVVNPGRAKQYLSFVDSRAKTDQVDARALARLAEREGPNLRAYQPVPEPIKRARDILVRRRSLVQARVAMEQVARETKDSGGHLGKAIAAAKDAQKALEKELELALKEYPSYQHLLSIPCIGPMSAAVLICALERGAFPTSDAFVAYAGLDPVSRDSGKSKGKRRLSHQGDAQIRTTLFMAARTGSRSDVWKPYYVNQLTKGLSSTEATVILARKLIRVAWSVHQQGSPFIQKNGPPLDTTT